MSRIVCQITVFPPSVNNLFANVQGKGRRKSERYRMWSRIAQTEILAGRAKWPIKRIGGPVEVVIELGRPDKRKRDLDNYAKALLDTLVEMDVIDDDRQIEDLRLRWRDDFKGARVEVTTAAFQLTAQAAE